MVNNAENNNLLVRQSLQELQAQVNELLVRIQQIAELIGNKNELKDDVRNLGSDQLLSDANSLRDSITGDIADYYSK
jgi:hypothetical protein